MQTVKAIKESVNVSEVLSNDVNEIYEGCTEKQVINWTTASNISRLIENVSKRFSNQVSYSVTNIYFEITNEEVINLFRELYKLTSNKFVKSVLVSVGKNKKFTEKQLITITDEIIKFENLTINF